MSDILKSMEDFHIHFFPGKELFFKNFDFDKRCLNEFKDYNVKVCCRFTMQCPKEWFYGLRSSQRPPASLGVKVLLWKWPRNTDFWHQEECSAPGNDSLFKSFTKPSEKIWILAFLFSLKFIKKSVWTLSQNSENHK